MFVKLMRTDDAEQLIATHPNAFLLLSLIAIRSRRHLDQCKWTGLSQNQAFIGDHKSCGLSEQEYRTAKLALTKLGIATFKGTNKGTISTLCDASIYDINQESINGQDNSPITNQQRTNNEPATTKKNEKKEYVRSSESEADSQNREKVKVEFEKITGKKIRVFGDKASAQLKARLKEGFTVEDIIQAIKNCHADKYHQENPKYLTLEFITRQTKLQTYLNVQKPSGKFVNFNKIYRDGVQVWVNREGQTQAEYEGTV